jgi:hypothetical protein
MNNLPKPKPVTEEPKEVSNATQKPTEAPPVAAP